MAQSATNPKIEELRFRLKTDPKSRLFYQLAEELRKAGQWSESEHVLRSGLTVYPAYLAAWVSLGRVLREQKKDGDAVEALTTALQLDPGNVVAARLLADAYLELGEKVEAIKKYKLVHALLPSDEALRGVIDRLDRELQPPLAAAETAPDEPPFGADDVAAEVAEVGYEQAADEAPAAGMNEASASERDEAPPTGGPPAIAEAPSADAESPFAVEPPAPMEESPFDETMPPFELAEQALAEEARVEQETGDVEPMLAAHEESPFEEPVGGFSTAAVEIESAAGIHIDAAPLAAEMPAPAVDDLPSAEHPVDLEPFAKQTSASDDTPASEAVDETGESAGSAPDVHARVTRLEQWLTKVSRREVGRV